MTIDEIDIGAIFSNDRKHRFVLWRFWNRELPMVMFVGLNPSSANEVESDPTIRSVVRIAKHNGYGGIYMTNCFSFISTDPSGLEFGEMQMNNMWLQITRAKCRDVVFAWGSFPIVKETGRDIELSGTFRNAMCLAINKNGSPKHPLYCKTETNFINYR